MRSYEYRRQLPAKPAQGAACILGGQRGKDGRSGDRRQGRGTFYLYGSDAMDCALALDGMHILRARIADVRAASHEVGWPSLLYVR